MGADAAPGGGRDGEQTADSRSQSVSFTSPCLSVHATLKCSLTVTCRKRACQASYSAVAADSSLAHKNVESECYFLPLFRHQ